jgi:photosynthetic reaction center cytochrome c subunit
MERTKMLLTRWLTVALCTFSALCVAQSGKVTDPSSPKTAEQVFKSIQVLKGIPADQLIPSMQFITASLGVQCDFCHVEKAFDKDDKEPKKTARKMMQMMSAINQENFKGEKEVTCYSCHRGAAKPFAVPVITDEAAPPPHESKASAETSEEKPPAPDAILEKYFNAVAKGASASRFSTSLEKGTMTVGAAQFPVEVLAKGPEYRITTVRFPGGDNITAYNTHVGWLTSPGRGTHEMSSAELDAARLDADPQFGVDLRRIFNRFESRPSVKIDGHPAYVVAGLREKYPPVELYFDQDSGLLLRLKRYIDTPLGLNPAQLDYADYRDENGMKVPFRWTIARPGGYFTIQIDQMEQNVPADDAKFAEPPPSKPEH